MAKRRSTLVSGGCAHIASACRFADPWARGRPPFAPQHLVLTKDELGLNQVRC
jgi:hypothetical protein